jgi:hypothetical protein
MSFPVEPPHEVGVLTGEQPAWPGYKLVVFDLDVGAKHARKTPPPDAWAALDALCPPGGLTFKDGVHRWALVPDSVEATCQHQKLVSGDGWAIDTRGSGGYVQVTRADKRNGALLVDDDSLEPVKLNATQVARLANTAHMQSASAVWEAPEQITTNDAKFAEALASIWADNFGGDKAFGCLGNILCDMHVSAARTESIALKIARLTSSTHKDPVSRALQPYGGARIGGVMSLAQTLGEDAGHKIYPEGTPEEQRAGADSATAIALVTIQDALRMIEETAKGPPPPDVAAAIAEEKAAAAQAQAEKAQALASLQPTTLGKLFTAIGEAHIDAPTPQGLQEVRCPWHAEHAIPDTATAHVQSTADGLGRFVCNDPACADRSPNDVIETFSGWGGTDALITEANRRIEAPRAHTTFEWQCVVAAACARVDSLASFDCPCCGLRTVKDLDSGRTMKLATPAFVSATGRLSCKSGHTQPEIALALTARPAVRKLYRAKGKPVPSQPNAHHLGGFGESLPDTSDAPDPRIIVSGLICASESTMWVGGAGSGKTTAQIVAALVVAGIASGHLPAHFRLFETYAIETPGPVVYIDYEQANSVEKAFVRWASWLGLKDGAVRDMKRRRFLRIVTRPRLLADSDVTQAYIDETLRLLVERCEGAAVCFVNSLIAGSGANENDANGMTRLVQGVFNRVVDLTGCAVVFLHHPGKNTNGEARGSSALLPAVARAMTLTKAEQGLPGKYTWTYSKDRDTGHEGSGFHMQLEVNEAMRTARLIAHRFTPEDVMKAKVKNAELMGANIAATQQETLKDLLTPFETSGLPKAAIIALLFDYLGTLPEFSTLDGDVLPGYLGQAFALWLKRGLIIPTPASLTSQKLKGKPPLYAWAECFLEPSLDGGELRAKLPGRGPERAPNPVDDSSKFDVGEDAEGDVPEAAVAALVGGLLEAAGEDPWQEVGRNFRDRLKRFQVTPTAVAQAAERAGLIRSRPHPSPNKEAQGVRLYAHPQRVN